MVDRFEDAAAYCRTRRAKIGPAVYNERRLGERPIPEIHPPVVAFPLNEISFDGENTAEIGIENEADNEVGGEFENDRAPVLLAGNANADIMQLAQANDDIREDIAEVEVKQEMSVEFDLNDSDVEMYEDILTENALGQNDGDDNVVNDLNLSEGDVMFEELDDGSFPMPKGYKYKLIKRENDVISGNEPFEELVIISISCCMVNNYYIFI